jgi:hypothetical protein
MRKSERSFPGKQVPDFRIQKFQLNGRESVPTEDPDGDEWKRANRD